jgi:predicted TIM-barrel fold metal-dependent hydrolase
MAERVRRQNAWACEVGAAHERLAPFVGVQKLLGGAGGAEEVRLGHARGAKGVKLQPGMNMFLPSDRELWPVYEAAQELGLPILTDSGTYGRAAPDGGPYGRPLNFVEVLESFPRLTLVMAHFASAYWDERVELAGRFPNLHFDVSGGFGADDVQARDDRRALPEEDAVRVLRKVGLHRFLFGTDGPSVMPQPYLEQILRLGLTDDERQLLLAGNARRLYAL